jgi:hypothetical protein
MMAVQVLAKRQRVSTATAHSPTLQCALSCQCLAALVLPMPCCLAMPLTMQVPHTSSSALPFETLAPHALAWKPCLLGSDLNRFECPSNKSPPHVCLDRLRSSIVSWLGLVGLRIAQLII